jgi:ribosomal protein S24E
MIKKFLRESKTAPAPKVTEFTVYVRGEFTKQKMTHIYDSMEHKEIIKTHYELLRDAMTSDLIPN